jgi:hypothetical protein
MSFGLLSVGHRWIRVRVSQGETMRAARKRAGILACCACLCVLILTLAAAQTQTTGRIAGTVRDAQGATIVSAAVTVENPATGDKRSATTDEAGSYSVSFLPPANYEINIAHPGFRTAAFHSVAVGVGATTTVNVALQLSQANVQVTVSDAPPLVSSDTSELNTTLEARRLGSLQTAGRNILQLLPLAPGVTAPLPNNNALGRNTPNVSVNGARVTQNSYLINGVDANNISMHDLGDVGVPAPESISEVKVQTSMYDASVSGAGGGSVQVITRSGTNSLHGNIYEYFRNEALNANDANLKAAGIARPPLKRNAYGATLGGPILKDRAFFFVSYQGTREANAATDQSLYKNVLIDSRLTDDRSEGTLAAEFGVSSIHPAALALLDARLPNGQFLIPTPQNDGRVTGTSMSTFHEEQFNANLDYRWSSGDLLAAKFFFADAPLFSALGGSSFGTPANLPGFGNQVNTSNRVLSVEHIHSFSPRIVNDARFGYNLIRRDELPQEPIKDGDIGIQRPTAAVFPGLPLIQLSLDGAAIGTSSITLVEASRSASFVDAITLQRGSHHLSLGGEIRRSEWHVPRPNVQSYGSIVFLSFEDFLAGNTAFSDLASGAPDRDALATDYHLFIQDEWKVSSKFTLNLGLRYELDPPPYDAHGRIGGFDPALYQPRLDENGLPIGPPARGMVEASNAPEGSIPGVLRVGKRILKSVDPNNFGPRIGLAWSPLTSGRLAVRAGYGIFYSRPSFFYLALNYFAPPFFLDAVASGLPLDHPFADVPPESSFPLVQVPSTLAATIVDRNARTPYYQHFNTSLQFEVARNTTLQIAYAGSRGVKLFRSVAINQARIASLNHPVVNQVTGEVITSNTLDNTASRAPMQGVDTGFFTLNESSAQSAYHSLQVTARRQVAEGLQFSANYTFSRSIDNASNPGGGALPNGSVDRGGGLDTGNVWGNQLSARANRGLSDFDRTHDLVVNFVWDLPHPGFADRTRLERVVLRHWQLAGIVTVISGLPVDVFDPSGGSLYGLFGARPNWAPGANGKTATSNVPAGYYFNPSAFVPATVDPGQPIPSAHDPTALASGGGTDLGNVGRNVLRGPRQSNVDLSVGKMFPVRESKSVEFRTDFFNLLNHANRDNPISDITLSDFGRIVSFSTSPRIVQLSLKFSF